MFNWPCSSETTGGWSYQFHSAYTPASCGQSTVGTSYTKSVTSYNLVVFQELRLYEYVPSYRCPVLGLGVDCIYALIFSEFAILTWCCFDQQV